MVCIYFLVSYALSTALRYITTTRIHQQTTRLHSLQPTFISLHFEFLNPSTPLQFFNLITKTYNMHFATTLLATTAILASSALAAPAPVPEPFHSKQDVDDCYCLSDADAQHAADIFQELIQNYSDELALETLTEDFVDYSSAVSIIINGGDGEPLNIVEPTFVGRQAFMDAQGSQPEIPFRQLNIYHGCDSVSMRWMTGRSAKGQETEVSRIVSFSIFLS